MVLVLLRMSTALTSPYEWLSAANFIVGVTDTARPV